MASKEQKNTYYVADDTGYGYLKSLINGEYIYVPTTLLELTSTSSYPAPVDLTKMSASEKDEYFDNIFDHQYVSFDDSALTELSKNRFLLGKNAYSQSGTTEIIDSNYSGGKAGQNNTYAFILSAIAYKRAKDEYEKNKENFDPKKALEATVKIMVTALPVIESKSDSDVEKFVNTFTNSTHTVNLWNFKDEHIQVNINFEKVEVTREGLIAQLALYNADTLFPKLLEHVNEQLTKDYGKDVYDAKTLFKSSSVLMLDIGAGTVDLVKIVNGEIKPDSTSIRDGYNTVMDNVVNYYLDNDFNGFSNAHDLDDFLKLTENVPANSKQGRMRDDIKKHLTENSTTLINQIMTKVRALMKGDAQNSIEAIVVLGGGAIGLNDSTNDEFKKTLKSEAKEMGMIIDGEHLGIPVVWVGSEDSKEATDLNLLGLKLQLQLLENE